VKQTKKTRKESNGQDKTTTNNWKVKAQGRSKENIRLRKRIKELTISRDNWKSKYFEVTSLPAPQVSVSAEKADRHHYPLVFIWLVMQFQSYGSMSLRSSRHCLCRLLLTLGLSSRVPSHSSIRNWLCKSGYYQLKATEANGGDYVVYVDESIVFGSEKILLILGVNMKGIAQDRALVHSDMEVLYVEASQEWKSETIADVLSKISLTKTIKYAVSDEGRNLCGAYKVLNYNHISDCTHIFANHLKRLYNTDSDFEDFRKLIGQLRKEWNLSKANSQYMPPGMRGKMRFANIFPCVNWAEKQLKEWSNLPQSVQNKLAFLKEKQAFINDLLIVRDVFKNTCRILKTEGFGVSQKRAIEANFDTYIGLDPQSKAGIFIENVKGYLENLLQKSLTLEQQHLLCSSDIIESFFGKFKAKINPNNRAGLTEFIFTIANFAQPLDSQHLKLALEKVKLKDLKLAYKRKKAA
jgi:hypothetical protein